MRVENEVLMPDWEAGQGAMVALYLDGQVNFTEVGTDSELLVHRGKYTQTSFTLCKDKTGKRPDVVMHIHSDAELSPALIAEKIVMPGIVWYFSRPQH